MNQKYIVTGSNDGSIRICSIELGREIKRIKGHHNQVRCVKYSNDNRFLATGSNDNTVKIWLID